MSRWSFPFYRRDSSGSWRAKRSRPSIAPPHQDLTALIGAIGEAKTDIFQEGSVYAGGEQWSARSDQPISSGARVRVLERDGFTLKVEAIEAPEIQKTAE